ncbi:dihydrodipicolinate synthase family protein [Psychrobacillus soli]|uniref:Dihydrodipicolinate synthase family protein n=1 Tax=Psychrobacillus soli TaxID=1543965 RepID=A0A544TDK0_9BACI|nr:dihydrodipicolinate synthase family protein [Psychrobacillus soli]TQR15533.1 dihydrodipicolinate synthase family protein [Psychrobacillus soli]
MSYEINLPNQEGKVTTYKLNEQKDFQLPEKPFQSRIAYAAAHVVFNPYSDIANKDSSSVDWEKTIEFRKYLWSLGYKIAEAMDTAQRGMGLDWELSKELIKRSLQESKITGGGVACGAGTDHLIEDKVYSLDEIIEAYLEQTTYIEKYDGEIILMASRALAKAAKSPEDYIYVYRKVLEQVEKPVILHWLGDMFDPKLANYWGYEDLDSAMDTCLMVIQNNTNKVNGIKLSLLDKDKEISMRNILPSTVKMYTGDDFNYPELIQGDKDNFSHALLGIFDPIAPIAAYALAKLDENDMEGYKAILEPTVPLARHIFQTPTFHYKTGVVFLAYLNGHQNHFRMVNGAENNRSIVHLSELFKLADQAGVLINQKLAIQRMNQVLLLSGVYEEETVTAF